MQPAAIYLLVFVTTTNTKKSSPNRTEEFTLENVLKNAVLRCLSAILCLTWEVVCVWGVV